MGRLSDETLGLGNPLRPDSEGSLCGLEKEHAHVLGDEKNEGHWTAPARLFPVGEMSGGKAFPFTPSGMDVRRGGAV